MWCGSVTGCRTPRAGRRPFVSGRELLSRAQDDSDLAAEFCLVAEVRGQLVLTSAADSFVRRVTWEGDVAAQWRPHDDPRSPVRMNPSVRFGRLRCRVSVPKHYGSTTRRARAWKRSPRNSPFRLTPSGGRLHTKHRRRSHEPAGKAGARPVLCRCRRARSRQDPRADPERRDLPWRSWRPGEGGRVRLSCPITDTATQDDVWIPETARQGWLILTRDRHIRDHRAETTLRELPL